MHRSLAFLAIATIPLAFAAAVAWAWDPAQTKDDCAPWEEVRTGLLTKYNEKPIGGGEVGPSSNGVRLFITVSPKGSFTLVAFNRRSGQACIGNWGRHWTTTKEGLEDLISSPVKAPVKEPDHD